MFHAPCIFSQPCDLMMSFDSVRATTYPHIQWNYFPVRMKNPSTNWQLTEPLGYARVLRESPWSTVRYGHLHSPYKSC